MRVRVRVRARVRVGVRVGVGVRVRVRANLLVRQVEEVGVAARALERVEPYGVGSHLHHELDVTLEDGAVGRREVVATRLGVSWVVPHLLRLRFRVSGQ